MTTGHRYRYRHRHRHHLLVACWLHSEPSLSLAKNGSSRSEQRWVARMEEGNHSSLGMPPTNLDYAYGTQQQRLVSRPTTIGMLFWLWAMKRRASPCGGGRRARSVPADDDVPILLLVGYKRMLMRKTRRIAEVGRVGEWVCVLPFQQRSRSSTAIRRSLLPDTSTHKATNKMK